MTKQSRGRRSVEIASAHKSGPRNDNHSIPRLYRLLLQTFGPQGWWPTTPAGSRKPVYHASRPSPRLSERERFEICLGALLTQNTSWSNVVLVLALLQLENVLDFRRLRRIPARRLERLFRSSGYFRQKTKRVQGFLAEVERSAGGRFSRFFRGEPRSVREKLLGISGIGPETADSMLLYAAGRPVFVVDAYTRRIGQRWGLFDGTETYDHIQWIFTSALPRSVRIFAEYHALLVALGKDFCRPVPRCPQCPVRKECPTGRRVISIESQA